MSTEICRLGLGKKTPPISRQSFKKMITVGVCFAYSSFISNQNVLVQVFKIMKAVTVDSEHIFLLQQINRYAFTQVNALARIRIQMKELVTKPTLQSFSPPITFYLPHIFCFSIKMSIACGNAKYPSAKNLLIIG